MTNSLVRFAGAGASVAMLMTVVMGCAGEQSGPPGPKPTDSATITGSIHCGGELEKTPLAFMYDADLFGNGNIFVSGVIADASGSSSHTVLYAPTQVGALTASVSVARDELGKANAGWWELSLDRVTLITTIINHDADLASGTQTWTMVPADCVVNAY